MRSDPEVDRLLRRELGRVKAPDGLWERVQPALDRRTPATLPMKWAWAGAFAAVAIMVWIATAQPGARALDLGPYLAPVQNASIAGSAHAIYRVPPNFQIASNLDGPSSFAGYTVAGQRLTRVGGEAVKQVILTAADNAVALFIASPKVRLRMGENHWVDDNLEGVACQRLNCPRVHTFQFRCAAETCVLVCKACSEKAMLALMTQVVARSPEFR